MPQRKVAREECPGPQKTGIAKTRKQAGEATTRRPLLEVDVLPCGLSNAHAANRGRARHPRQKAVAVGPVSDRRTRIPAPPVDKAPAKSAINAPNSA